jgi:hypothetical protein
MKSTGGWGKEGSLNQSLSNFAWQLPEPPVVEPDCFAGTTLSIALHFWHGQTSTVILIHESFGVAVAKATGRCIVVRQ